MGVIKYSKLVPDAAIGDEVARFALKRTQSVRRRTFESFETPPKGDAKNSIHHAFEIPAEYD